MMNQDRSQVHAVPRHLTWLWVAALVSILTYLTVSASQEFGPFSPLRASPPVLYGATFVVGLLVGLLPYLSRCRPLALAMVVLLPGLIYGTGLVVLFTLLGGTALLDMIIFWAAQRVLVYLVVTGVLLLSGFLIGLVIVTYRGE